VAAAPANLLRLASRALPERRRALPRHFRPFATHLETIYGVNETPMVATKTYETKQAAMCDCGHDYGTHEKPLRGKLIYVYRHPRTDEPCYCDAFTITMKKVRKTQRRMKKNRTPKANKKS
jgi:hypothetical protein